jgi:Sec-independent protein translocase protein TatA
MNIGLGQFLLIALVCFLLFGNVSNVLSNLKILFDKAKETLSNSK